MTHLSSSNGLLEEEDTKEQPVLRVPSEIIQLIATHLPYSAQLALKFTCRRLYSMAPADWHGISIDDYFTSPIDAIMIPRYPRPSEPISLSPSQFLPPRWLQRLELSIIADWPGFEHYRLCYGCTPPRLKDVSCFGEWGIARQRGRFPETRTHSFERHETLKAMFDSYVRISEDQANDIDNPTGRDKWWPKMSYTTKHFLETRHDKLFPRKQQTLCHACLCMAIGMKCRACNAHTYHKDHVDNPRYNQLNWEAVCEDCGIDSHQDYFDGPHRCDQCLARGIDEILLEDTTELRATMVEEIMPSSL